MNLSERLNTPISTAELERRWAAVRAAMEAEKIDVLLMQNNNDHMGGYVKYFTDLPATNGYPMTVVFPRDDAMTIVGQGPFGMVKELPKEGDGMRRGVKTWMTTPSYASAYYTAAYDPELAAKALAPYGGGTIGLVGSYQMSVALVDHLRNGRFSNSKFVDASDLVDRIKVIKSPEEMELIRRAAHMQDGAMRAAFGALEPGMREADIGGDRGMLQPAGTAARTASISAPPAPIGTPCQISQRHYAEPCHPRRRLRDAPGGGQRARRLLHRARPDLRGRQGAAANAGRVRVHARGAPLHARPAHARARPARRIWDEYNAFMRQNGRPEEARLYCHGQGYDLVERPLVRNDEPMTIQKDMNIVVHPTYVHNEHDLVGVRQLPDRGQWAGRTAAPFSGGDRRIGIRSRGTSVPVPTFVSL